MNKYSILCPTRNRSGRCKAYAESIFKTATRPDRVELLLYVDNDDPHKGQYQGWTSGMSNVILVIGEPISVSKSWNVIARKATGNILMMGNDDLFHETSGWDVRLDEETAKFPDEIYCIWVNDKHKGDKLCTFPTVSRKWYETVGYFAPGVFFFFRNDTWIQDLGRRIDRLHYVPNVTIEHRHWSYGFEKDETTLRNRKTGKNTVNYAVEDAKIWRETETKREEDANKLLQVIGKINEEKR